MEKSGVPGREPGKTGFTVDTMLSLPRLSGLVLSPDGTRLVVSASRESDGGKKMSAAIFELDLPSEGPPTRLTRSKPGESSARFAPDGSLLFVSARPDTDDGDSDDEPKSALWRLPVSGEAQPVASPSGGVSGFSVARRSGDILYVSGSYPGVTDDAENRRLEKAREEAGVGARLLTGYPIRFWDGFLGPREPRLYFKEYGSEVTSRDLTPAPKRDLDQTSFDISPDGTSVSFSRWSNTDDPKARRLELVLMDVKSGEETILANDEAWYSSPAFSPDGRSIVACRSEIPTPAGPGDHTLYAFDPETGEVSDLLPDLDLWPGAPTWSPDGRYVFFTADEDGHCPVFRLDPESGSVVRLSKSGAYSDLCPAPDGETIYALRSTISEPPRPVALSVEDADAKPRVLPGFPESDGLELPARVERVTATSDDGETVPSWLLLPPGASAESPAPLAVLVHGGPLNSWNSWHWRWNPHVFVEEGWAVLLPDPALSTGYGLDGIARGWGRWGSVVYRDVMAAVDGAVGREDVDGSRTAALGGSFGGYMANWIAGHTDRFGAVVTHASLWNLESFHGTTDLGVWWEREFGDPYTDATTYRENSPHLHIAEIRTPVLVIHGELDYRVPVSEALTLWTDLKRHGVEAEFLYYPDENHWILKPNNSRLWYGTVLDFIASRVLGEERKGSDLL